MKTKVKQIAPIAAEILIKAVKAFSEKYVGETVPVYVITDDIVQPGPTTKVLSELLSGITKDTMGVDYALYITSIMPDSKTPYVCVWFKPDIGVGGCFNIAVLTMGGDDTECHYSEVVENYRSTVENQEDGPEETILREKTAKLVELINVMSKDLSMAGSLRVIGLLFPIISNNLVTHDWRGPNLTQHLAWFKQLRELIGEISIQSLEHGIEFRANISVMLVVNGVLCTYVIHETNGVIQALQPQAGWQQDMPMMEQVAPFGYTQGMRPMYQGNPGMQEGYPGMYPMYRNSVINPAAVQSYRPNLNVKPPKYQTVSEGGNPYEK